MIGATQSSHLIQPFKNYEKKNKYKRLRGTSECCRAFKQQNLVKQPEIAFLKMV